MVEKKYEVRVDGVPYIITASPFTFNTETRYEVSFNGVEHIFAWDSSLGRLASIDEDASKIPDNLELEIAKLLESDTKI